MTLQKYNKKHIPPKENPLISFLNAYYSDLFRFWSTKDTVNKLAWKHIKGDKTIIIGKG